MPRELASSVDWQFALHSLDHDIEYVWSLDISFFSVEIFSYNKLRGQNY